MLLFLCTLSGVLAVSWYPPTQADDQGKPWDSLMLSLMDTANRYNLKVFIEFSASSDDHGYRINL